MRNSCCNRCFLYSILNFPLSLLLKVVRTLGITIVLCSYGVVVVVVVSAVIVSVLSLLDLNLVLFALDCNVVCIYFVCPRINRYYARYRARNDRTSVIAHRYISRVVVLIYTMSAIILYSMIAIWKSVA